MVARQPPEDFQIEHWVYKGLCLLEKGPLGHEFVVIEDEDDRDITDESVCRVFKKSAFSTPLVIGGVYNIQASDTRVYPSTLTYRHLLVPDDLRLKWQVSSDALHVEYVARNAAKHDKREKVIESQLEPIRQIWLETNPLGRCAIETQVLRYLKFGRRD